MGNLINRISHDLLLPASSIRSLIKSAPMRYKVYTIPKRSGKGRRQIAQPTPAVKELQRWAINNVLVKFNIHEAATAYKRKSSIFINANVHKNSKYLLKMDFENFFNSIKSHDLLYFLSRQKVDMDEDDQQLLCKILFWRPKGADEMIMSIGSPSSPMLCNILLYDFDVFVSTHCLDVDVLYTRYADDMAFSCNDPWKLGKIEEWITQLIDKMQSPRLKINKEKSIHVSKKSSRRVTGLILTNDGMVSLGRKRKRQLRAMVHKFSLGKMSEVDASSLRGWLAYVNAVEPSYIKRLKITYDTEILNRLGIN